MLSIYGFNQSCDRMTTADMTVKARDQVIAVTVYA